MLAPMRIFTLVFCLLLASVVHATPTDAPDDAGSFLINKDVLSQIDQVRQKVTDEASSLVGNALGFLGVPYRRGGSSAETGFDCSGFVKSMYEQTVGLILPRKAEQQAAATQRIDKADLQPGDLVFFNTMRRAFSHVGIYIGEGKFVHSPKPGSEVRIESMSLSYWTRRFDGARRVQTADTSSPAVQALPMLDPLLR
jgi:cell wall-associated NlpC family hydrolase